jgi:CDGSH-type Zn-finger protein
VSERKKPYILEDGNIPYCDGTHQGTDNKPFVVMIEDKKTVAICGCGESESLPYCDGSHATLP